MTRDWVWAALAVSTVALMTATASEAGEVFAGVYAHDVDDGISYGKFEHGAQIVVGARTTALDELHMLGRPRVHLLMGINTDGDTDYIASGLSWRFRFARRFYIEPGVGIAIHDGKVNLPSPDEPGLTPEQRLERLHDYRTKLDLSSRVLFEPELSLGYRATDRLSLELSWIHMSHGRLAGSYNPGVADVGMRLLYRYGLDR